MSERKKIISYVQDPIKVACYHDKESNEYQVRVYVDNGNEWRYQGDKNTYYTNDLQDALITMNNMLFEWHKKANFYGYWENIDVEIPASEEAKINAAFARIREALAEADQAINSQKAV